MPTEKAISGLMRGGLQSDVKRHLNILAMATCFVALVYAGLVAWLLLNGSPTDGEPIMIVTLAPEPTPPPESLLRTEPPDEDTAHPVRTPPAKPGPSQPALSKTTNPLTAPAVPEAAIRLPPVPDPSLFTLSKNGPLPVIGSDGRRAYEVYARPAPPDAPGLSPRPRIALIIGGMGISTTATTNAIEKLPPEISLSFAPYGNDLQSWVHKARSAGHEVLLELPMEPYDYPENDPGPYTLLTQLTAPQNIDRLEWLLSRFVGYAGVMNYQGAKFAASDEAVRPILEALSSRGLMYVDNGAWARTQAPQIANEVGLPLARGTMVIDAVQNPTAIGKALAELEKAASASGTAVGVGTGFPVTVEQIAEWAKALHERGFQLVPVTATVAARRN